MLDNIELIIVAVVAGLVLLALKPAPRWIVLWIVWRWRRYRAHRVQRRAERERYLNENVRLTTGGFMHRGCAGRKEPIIEPGPNTEFMGMGGCERCCEHLKSPRAKGVRESLYEPPVHRHRACGVCRASSSSRRVFIPVL